MTITQFFRIISRNLHYLLAIPILTGILLFYLTRNLTKTYQSNVVIYAITKSQSASASGDVVKMDFFTSNNLFDNITLIIKSRETIKETGLRLLALHLSLARPVDSVLSPKYFNELHDTFRNEQLKQLQVIGNPSATLDQLKNSTGKNAATIDFLIRNHPNYSHAQILSRLKVARKQSSDMVDVAYTASDPGVCYFTLKYITEVFAERYKNLKKLENENSIAYFESQLKQAKEKLNQSEGTLKDFISLHNIINYYEQGKYLDIMNRDQDKYLSDEKERMAGTYQNIVKLEDYFRQYELRQEIIDSLLDYQRMLRNKQMEVEYLIVKGGSSSEIERKKKDVATLEQTLRLSTDRLFASSNTEKGIEKKRLVEEWLKLKIDYENQKEAVKFKQKRKEELDLEASLFAPLGAELKKLERAVTVNENQYLSILHGLNMAYLKKYDLDSYSTQSLLDPPYFPKNPDPSKRMILVIGGALASFILVLIVLLAGFFLDRSIRTVARAEKNTGCTVIGGYPNEKKIGRRIIKTKLTDQLDVYLLNKLRPTVNKTEQLISVLSLRDEEGKTKFLEQLQRQIQLLNNNYQLHVPHKVPEQLKNTLNYSYAEVGANGSAFIQNCFANNKDGLTVVEFPSLSSRMGLFDVLNQSTMVIVVIDAGRKWGEADNRNLRLLKESVNQPITVWLNRMNPDELEDFTGEIPRRRSWIRKRIKKLITG